MRRDVAVEHRETLWLVRSKSPRVESSSRLAIRSSQESAIQPIRNPLTPLPASRDPPALPHACSYRRAYLLPCASAAPSQRRFLTRVEASSCTARACSARAHKISSWRSLRISDWFYFAERMTTSATSIFTRRVLDPTDTGRLRSSRDSQCSGATPSRASHSTEIASFTFPTGLTQVIQHRSRAHHTTFGTPTGAVMEGRRAPLDGSGK